MQRQLSGTLIGWITVLGYAMLCGLMYSMN